MLVWRSFAAEIKIAPSALRRVGGLTAVDDGLEQSFPRCWRGIDVMLMARYDEVVEFDNDVRVGNV